MIALVIFLCYVGITALIGGWLYATDYDDRWFYVAAIWPIIPFIVIVWLIGYAGYKAKQYFDKL